MTSQSRSSSSLASSKLEKVDEDSLQRELSANDLIGEEVVSREGNSLGEIVDVVISGQDHLAQNSQRQQSRDQGQLDQRSGNASTSGAAARPNTGMETSGTMETAGAGQNSIGNARTDRDSAVSGDRSERTGIASRSNTNTGITAGQSGSENTTMGTSSDRAGSDMSSRSGSAVASASSQVRDWQSDISQGAPSVVISSGGGLFGGDENMVKVPLSELSRNGDGELQLNVSEEEFQEVAQRETSSTRSQYGLRDDS